MMMITIIFGLTLRKHTVPCLWYGDALKLCGWSKYTFIYTCIPSTWKLDETTKVYGCQCAFAGVGEHILYCLED